MKLFPFFSFSRYALVQSAWRNLLHKYFDLINDMSLVLKATTSALTLPISCVVAKRQECAQEMLLLLVVVVVAAAAAPFGFVSNATRVGAGLEGARRLSGSTATGSRCTLVCRVAVPSILGRPGACVVRACRCFYNTAHDL